MKIIVAAELQLRDQPRFYDGVTLSCSFKVVLLNFRLDSVLPKLDLCKWITGLIGLKRQKRTKTLSSFIPGQLFTADVVNNDVNVTAMYVRTGNRSDGSGSGGNNSSSSSDAFKKRGNFGLLAESVEQNLLIARTCQTYFVRVSFYIAFSPPCYIYIYIEPPYEK